MVQHTHGVYFVRFIKHVSKIIALQVNIITLTLQAWFARVSRLRIYIYQIVCIRYRLNTGRWLADRRQPWSKAMVVQHILSLEVYSCFLFHRAARGSRIVSNTADILTEVMHLNSTGGLTCEWRIRGYEW